MAEKKVIELEIKDNVSSLKSQLRQATAEVALMAEKFGATSKEAADAAKRAAELKDMIADAKDLTDAFNPDAKFNALSNSIGGVLNGFQAYEGALGLIGVESESLQKTLLKVQSAMALSQGIQGALEAKDSFVQLGSVVKNAFAGMTQGAKLFLVSGIGLVIAGIGLAIANWDKLQSVMSNQTSTQKILNEVMLQSSEAIKDEVNASDKLSKQLKDENLSREQKIEKVKQFQKDYPGLISNMTLEKGNLKDINNELVTNIKLLKLQSDQKAIEALRAEKLQEKLKLQLDIQKDAQKYAGEFTLNLGSSANNGWIGYSSGAENAKLATMEVTKIVTDGTKEIDKQIKSLDKATKETEKSIDKLTKAGAKSKEEVTKQDSDAEKKAQEIEDKRKERIKKSIELRKSELDKIKELYNSAKIENEARLRTEQEQEEFQVTSKYSSQIALFKKHGKDTSELEIAQLNELNDIRLKYQKIQEDKEKEKQDKINQIIEEAKKNREQLELEFNENISKLQDLNTEAKLTEAEREKRIVEEKYFALEQRAKGNAEQEKIIAEAKARELDAIDKNSKDKQIERENQLRQARFQMAYDTLNLISNITELFGRRNEKQARIAFGIDKAAKLASATIAGIEGTIEAYKTAQKSPITAVFPAYPIVQAGLAGAFAATNIAKIAQTQFNANGSSVNSTTPSGGQSYTPQFNVVGSSGVNQLAQVQQQPVKAYITSGDVVSAMSLERNKLQKTSI